MKTYLSEYNIVKNDTKAMQGLKIEEGSIECLSDCFFILDKSFFEECEVSIDNIKMLANFTLYIEDDDEENVAYPFNFDLNFLLPIYFTDYEEVGGEVKIKIQAGNTLIADSFYKNDVNVAYQYFVKFMSGKINEQPQLSYSELLVTLKDVLSSNEIKGHASLEMEIFLQGLCRSSKNPDEPFRLTAKHNSSAKDFVMVNIRDIPRLESAFNAIASENINVGVVKTLNSDSNIQMLSPLEKIALSKR